MDEDLAAEIKAQRRAERGDPVADALEDEVFRLREKLQAAQRRLDEHLIGVAEFQVGDEVEVQTYGADWLRWRPAVVRQVVPRSWTPVPEYHVALLTKAGVPGRVTRSVASIRRPA